VSRSSPMAVELDKRVIGTLATMLIPRKRFLVLVNCG
jgi:hypothetical protein